MNRLHFTVLFLAAGASANGFWGLVLGFPLANLNFWLMVSPLIIVPAILFGICRPPLEENSDSPESSG